MAKVPLNMPALDFSLPDYKGQTFRLSDQRGKAQVVLVFNRGFF